MIEYYDKTCKCGCGHRIEIKKGHGYSRIPKYIYGHHRKGSKQSKEAKRKMSLAKIGGKFSDEHRRKMSLSKLGKKLSDEHRRKLSLAKLGDKNHNYGKKLSEETKRKLRENAKINPNYGMKGKKCSDETKRKLSLAKLGDKHHNYGKKLSEETRIKISLAKIGEKRSDETKRKISLAKIGGKLSDEHKRKLSLSKLGEKNPSWCGGLSFEPYTKDFNIGFKNSIRRRDNQVCMVCGVHREKLSMAFDVHHVNYCKTLSVTQNCVSLCRSCHSKTNLNRKGWISFFHILLSERYGYEYGEDGEVIFEILD